MFEFLFCLQSFKFLVSNKAVQNEAKDNPEKENGAGSEHMPGLDPKNNIQANNLT